MIGHFAPVRVKSGVDVGAVSADLSAPGAEPAHVREMRAALNAVRAYAAAHTTNLGSLAHDSISARHVLALLPPEETSAQGGPVNGPRVSARVDVPLLAITPRGDQ